MLINEAYKMVIDDIDKQRRFSKVAIEDKFQAAVDKEFDRTLKHLTNIMNGLSNEIRAVMNEHTDNNNETIL